MRALDDGNGVGTLAAEAGSPVGLSKRTLERAAFAFCVVAMAGGIFLRWANLSRESLWFDEGYTAFAVSHSLGEIVRIIKVDTAPPLYYLLLWGWTHLLGYSESALRSMSALMASAAVLVFVGIVGRIFRSPIARAAAIGMFCFSFMQISYAHEARFYSMMTLLGAIDVYLVLLVCDRSTPARIAMLCIAWSASLWTNNVMAVYLLCLGLAWLVLPGQRSIRGRITDAAIVSFISGLSFLIWVPALLAQTRRIQGAFWPDTPDFSLLLRAIAVLAGVNEKSLPRGDEHGFVIIGVIAILVLIPVWRSPLLRRWLIGLSIFGLLPIVLIFIYSHIRQSIFMERAFLPTGIVMPLLVVMPIECARVNKKLSVGLAGLFLYLSLASIPGHRLGEHGEAWREACAFSQSTHAAHRLVVCDSSDGETLFRYYACHRDYGPRSDVTGAPASFFALNPPQTMQRVKMQRDLDLLRVRLREDPFDELVLIASHTWYSDKQELALSLLKTELKLVDSRNFGRITVFQFVRRNKGL